MDSGAGGGWGWAPGSFPGGNGQLLSALPCHAHEKGARHGPLGVRSGRACQSIFTCTPLAFDGCALGSTRVSTPSFSLAFAFSATTSPGSGMTRWKAP